jgi:hypothetical protein
VQEAILAEEQACNLHPFNGRDLLVELEEICAPSQLFVVISNALVHLGMLPIQDIP